MKALWIALLLLGLLIFGIVQNSIYINKVANDLNERLDALPDPGDPSCEEQVAQMLEAWEARMLPVSLSVPFPLIDRISEQLSLLLACTEQGDFFGFQAALVLLDDAIEDMRHLEKLSVENLL